MAALSDIYFIFLIIIQLSRTGSYCVEPDRAFTQLMLHSGRDAQICGSQLYFLTRWKELKGSSEYPPFDQTNYLLLCKKLMFAEMLPSKIFLAFLLREEKVGLFLPEGLSRAKPQIQQPNTCLQQAKKQLARSLYTVP